MRGMISMWPLEPKSMWQTRKSLLAKAVDNSWTVQELLSYLATKPGRVTNSLFSELSNDYAVRNYPTLTVEEYLLIKQYE